MPMTFRRITMKRRDFIPSSPTPLEQRVTLSRSGIASAAPMAAVLNQSHSMNLYGFVLGTDTAIGSVHRLHAARGTVAPLGEGSLGGFLVIPTRGAANRPVDGLVKFSNAHGTVTLTLSGTVTVHRGSFAFGSGTFTYTIIAGTKAYKGAKATGPVLYGPGPIFAPGRFLLDFGNYPPPP
jgi:hypothetical protein